MVINKSLASKPVFNYAHTYTLAGGQGQACICKCVCVSACAQVEYWL